MKINDLSNDFWISVRNSIIKEADEFCQKHNNNPTMVWSLRHNYSYHIQDDRLFVTCGINIIYFVDLPMILENGNKNQ